MPLPDPLEIRPRSGLSARVNVPGSKSLSNRALPIAALARGTSTLTGGLASDDTNVMIGSLEALGCRVERAGGSWRRDGTPLGVHCAAAVAMAQAAAPPAPAANWQKKK